MRAMSFVKIALLAGAVALPASFSVAEAKGKVMKLPPGACAVGKKSVLANGAICSSKCDPVTMWCGDQLCANGQLVAVLPCLAPFCPPKCGG